MGRVQTKSELLWYRFDGTGTSVPNLAISPPGHGHRHDHGRPPRGALMRRRIIGSGVTSTTDYVNTGWATSLGATS
jgi:hypothetical protein